MLPPGPGVFYAFRPSGYADAGIGTGDMVFRQPFTWLLVPLQGSGNLCGAAPRSTTRQLYYSKQLTPVPTQGAGNPFADFQYNPLLYGPNTTAGG